MKKVFIDGSAGTTGLRIYERLSERKDIDLIILDDEVRKDYNARYEALNQSDITFLCLPDSAAKEAVLMAENKNTVIIDTSTAHRVNDDWTYGFAEIEGQKEKIAKSKRIANPGCHASGFIALVEPLVRYGIIKNDAKLNCYSLTGYSGGGKKMIAEYEDEANKESFLAPRLYSLSQSHKHLPEISKVCNLKYAPLFTPIVSSYYSGMEVSVQIFADEISGNIDTIKKVYGEYYKGDIIKFSNNPDEGGFLSASSFSGRDDMQVCVYGNDERISLISRFDNLGKGASGAAIQNMNIVMGIDEKEGLNIGGQNK